MGWVEHPGLYHLDASATLELASRACGGWATASDVVGLRRIRLVRRMDGQAKESVYYVHKVTTQAIPLKDGDELTYEAVHW